MNPMFNPEQAEASMRDMASMMHVYYTNLIAQGFTKSQAILIVIEFQKATITGGNT